MAKRKLKFWNVPVTEPLDDALEHAVKVNAHVSKADFIREAVRGKLDRMGLKITLEPLEDQNDRKK